MAGGKDGDMKVKVGADTGGLVNKLDGAVKALNKTGASAKKAGNEGQKAMSQWGKALDKAGSSAYDFGNQVFQSTTVAETIKEAASGALEMGLMGAIEGVTEDIEKADWGGVLADALFGASFVDKAGALWDDAVKGFGEGLTDFAAKFGVDMNKALTDPIGALKDAGNTAGAEFGAEFSKGWDRVAAKPFADLVADAGNIGAGVAKPFGVAWDNVVTKPFDALATSDYGLVGKQFSLGWDQYVEKPFKDLDKRDWGPVGNGLKDALESAFNLVSDNPVYKALFGEGTTTDRIDKLSDHSAGR